MRTYSYTVMKNRANKFNKMVIERCKTLSIKAGLDPNLLGIHPHNALVAYEYGYPWPEVNYKLCKKINWLFSDYQWRAHRLVDSLHKQNKLHFEQN